MNKHLVFLLLLLSPGLLMGQMAVNGWMMETIQNPSQLGIVETVPLDINQDGLMDVVSVSINDGELRAYINQDDFIFTEQVLLDGLEGAFRLTVTELNGDGQPDFIIPSIFSHEIIAAVSSVNGYNRITVAEGVLVPTDAKVADFNGDGKLDVVSTSFEEGVVLIHLQDTLTSFTTMVLNSQVVNPRKLLVDDFNQDGLVDFLLASSGDNRVRLYQNVGNLQFEESLVSDQLIGVRNINPCDINGDSHMDFIASATDSNTLVGFISQGDGNFSGFKIVEGILGPDALACHNLDQDADQELIVVSRTTDRIYQYDLTDTNTTKLIANSRDGYISLNFINLGDLNEPFVLTQSFFENRNLVYRLNPNIIETVVWEDFPDGVSALAEGDFNQDGVQDIAVSTFRDDRIQWYDGTNHQRHIIAEDIDGAADITAVDLDGDNLLDLLSAASFGNAFYWHRNLDGINFETITIYDTALFAKAIAVADVNGDFVPDVVGVSGSDDAVRWFERNGTSFTSHLISQTNDAPNQVEVVDVDQDGWDDLVVPNFFSDDISLFLNTGGHFSEVKLIENQSRPYSVAVKPGSSPTLPDIIGTLSGNGRLVSFGNLSNAAFSEHILNLNFPNPRNLLHDEATGQTIVISPDDAAIYAIKDTEGSGQITPIMVDHEGVSSLIQRNQASLTLLTGSMNSGLIVQLNYDLIFVSGFDDGP